MTMDVINRVTVKWSCQQKLQLQSRYKPPAASLTVAKIIPLTMRPITAPTAPPTVVPIAIST